MKRKYVRIWMLPAAVAVAAATQGVTQAQTTDQGEEKAASQATQAEHQDALKKSAQSQKQEDQRVNQAAPDWSEKTRVQADKDKMDKSQKMGKMTSQMMSGKEPQQFRAASQLIGTELENAQGEELGEVDEVVLDQSNNRVAYVVLSHGGWADIGDKLFAIPFDAIKWGEGEQPSILPISRERFENAPGFDESNWPDMADRKWSTEVDKFWQDQTRQNRSLEAQRASRPAGELRWVSMLSSLIGRDVDNNQDHLGEVEDIYIDEQGRLGFAAISFGGVLGVGDQTAIVPFNALNPRMAEDDFLLTATEADLKATVVNDQLEPGLNGQTMAKINKQFGAEPYWEQSSRKEMQAQRDRMRQQIAQQRAQRDRPQQASSNKDWTAESDYNKQFKADKVQTYQGTIVSVGEFEPGSDAEPGLRLRVRTDAQKMLTVHAGPRQYIQEQNISLNPGDKVSIQGAEAEIDDRPVVLASQIKVKQQTLNLRDQSGKPQWKLEQKQSIQQASPERSTRVTGEQEKLSEDRKEEMKDNIEDGADRESDALQAR